MTTAQVAFGPRVAKSPYFDSTIAAGASTFTVYNHMLLPVSYGDPLGEYWSLINGVSMWDVSVQVQVEISGPDASALTQAVVCRDLSKVVVGQARYAPMVDHQGRLINDPLLLRVDENRWWLSLADSDMVYWCRAIAAERGLEASVGLCDVSPLAVQGPKSPDVVAELCGEWVRDLGFFRFRHTDVDGIPLWVGRAGWSGQDGYELYLLDSERGADLWQLVAEAGRPCDITPSGPNQTERIESFLFSFRSDTPEDADPFEARLQHFVDLHCGADFIGREALVARHSCGLQRQLVGVMIEALESARPGPGGPAVSGADPQTKDPALTGLAGSGVSEVSHPNRQQDSGVPGLLERDRAALSGPPMPGQQHSSGALTWLEQPCPATVDGRTVGTVRAAAYSPRLERNIGLAFVDTPHNAAGTVLDFHTPAGQPHQAEVTDLPFIAPQPRPHRRATAP